MRKLTLWTMPFLLLFTLSLGAPQADLIQCPGNGGCQGTGIADLMNGTDTPDVFINGLEGDDVIFANGDDDLVNGGLGNDIIFGGAGDDNLQGSDDNDVLLAGPDTDQTSAQRISLGDGTDAAFVFAGEIQGCLLIHDGNGNDVANLIGFGPYSATIPFGQPGFGVGFVLVIDPITGGQIFIEVEESSNEAIETIHGLPSPNVTIVNFNALGNCDQFL